ncbi:phage tail protein [Candidatus Magnetaquicoccus inordinatus]|uniref:phage tail protein n=1 Tax=Candidatus Magnetaquicoccus inordinatus TaxID=2496818 RepID=UPI00102BBFBE|nr:tail fiber protein [Candidatus Magnetaquicoccus inordinatus]
MDPYIGMILPFPYKFAPVGWNFCAGQSLPLNQYQVLYSLIGSLYGGDDKTAFNLPELRGRMLIGAGIGQQGLSPYQVAQKGGAETTALALNQLPPHNHPATFQGTGGSADTPLKVTIDVSHDANDALSTPDSTHNFLGPAATEGTEPVKMWSKSATSPISLGGIKTSGSGGGITGGTVTIGAAGGGQRFSLLNPYLAMNFCIAMTGTYPERP